MVRTGSESSVDNGGALIMDALIIANLNFAYLIMRLKAQQPLGAVEGETGATRVLQPSLIPR